MRATVLALAAGALLCALGASAQTIPVAKVSSLAAASAGAPGDMIPCVQTGVSKACTSAQIVKGGGAALTANNLADLPSPAAARTNLGLAPSATTDTTNASNIGSGTLPGARLPQPSPSVMGGVLSTAPVTHQFATGLSTAGSLIMGQPSAGDVSFTQPQSGAVSRLLSAHVQEECVHPQDYGATGNGTTDDSAAILAAYNAAGSTGKGCVYVPPGQYLIASALSLTAYNNIAFVCAQKSAPSAAASPATVFVPGSATQDVFDIGPVSGFSMRNCAIKSGSQQTAGVFVNIAAGSTDLAFDDLYLYGAYIGVKIADSNVISFNRLRAYNFANEVLYLTGSSSYGGAADVYLYNAIMDEANASLTPEACIYTDQTGGSLTVIGSDMLHCHNGLEVNPGAGQFASWIYYSNDYIDTCDQPKNLRGGVGILVTPHGGGIANGASFSNMWSSTCSVSVKLVGDSQSTLSDYQFTNGRFLNSYGDGVELNYVNQVGFTNTTISGGSQSSANTYDGVVIGPNSTQINFTGGVIGPSETYAPSFRWALNINAGMTGSFTCVGTDITGNKSGAVLDNGSMSAPITFTACPGYNPQGMIVNSNTTLPTGTAYGSRSGAFVSVYPNSGGTITSTVVGGQTVCQAGPCEFFLGAEQTYSINGSGTATALYNKQ